MRTRADSPTKTCTEPECSGALRARGLCSTHYNQQHQPQRHAAKPATCTVCSAPVHRPPSSSRRPVCSAACRRVLAFGPQSSGASGYTWASDAVKRAERAGALVVEHFDRLEIFERDGWTCYLCVRQTDPEASVFDPASPTVDHVVPLSKGGEHSRSNARTACLGCNSAKQDGELGPSRSGDPA